LLIHSFIFSWWLVRREDGGDVYFHNAGLWDVVFGIVIAAFVVSFTSVVFWCSFTAALSPLAFFAYFVVGIVSQADFALGYYPLDHLWEYCLAGDLVTALHAAGGGERAVTLDELLRINTRFDF